MWSECFKIIVRLEHGDTWYRRKWLMTKDTVSWDATLGISLAHPDSCQTIQTKIPVTFTSGKSHLFSQEILSKIQQHLSFNRQPSQSKLLISNCCMVSLHKTSI